MVRAVNKAPQSQRRAPKGYNLRQKGDFVEPDYLLKLMDHLGPTAAADELGIAASTLHRARKLNQVSRVFEVAARGIWQEEYAAEAPEPVTIKLVQSGPRTTNLDEAVPHPTNDNVTLFLVQVPKGREAILEKAVAALGGTFFAQA